MIKQITTEYIHQEDRIRLTCIHENNSAIIIWLTHRLACRLIPALIQPLQKELKSIIKAEHAHQSVRFATKPGTAPPVSERPVIQINSSWLAVKIDVSRQPHMVKLTFRGQLNQETGWLLPPELLRKWLEILYSNFLKGGWDVSIWPEWLKFGHLETDMSTTIWH